MRGAHVPRRLAHMGARIIPAYAGSTRSFMLHDLVSEDHPRVCGEHESELQKMSPDGGSSPRMRGAQLLGGRTGEVVGIIPTYAGSTCIIKFAHPESKDDPRVCGEHLDHVCASPYHQGSSPRMRGAPAEAEGGLQAHGIIPAYAGSTRCRITTIRFRRDHRRVCGEHFRIDVSSVSLQGSSPRMRGALYS